MNRHYRFPPFLRCIVLHTLQLLLFLLLLLLIGVTGNIAAEPFQKLSKRTPYPISLAKLSATAKNHAVRITPANSSNYRMITATDDIFVKIRKNGRQKTVYREPADKAYNLSDFEAEQLQIVCKSLTVTLEQFEKNVRGKHWGHCLYLDGYLPKFIRNFYLLISVARNEPEKYTQTMALLDTKFDVSLRSPRSEARIHFWRIAPQYSMKLRIASKELIYQLKIWEKRELANKKRNPELSLWPKCEESLNLFVRIYFNIMPPTPLSSLKKR